MKRRNVRTLSLIVVTFTYLLIGAAVFDFLEGTNNERAYEGLQTVKRDFVQRYNVSQDDYKIMELLIIEKKPHKAGPQWKFAGSFYYALVVLTLIGYGHSTPATTFGKAFTMIYAIMGIPMAMVMFQSMGERMNKFYSVLIKGFREWRLRRRYQQHHVHDHDHVDTDATEFDLIIASAITSNIVIYSGAVMYTTQEGWSYFDALYYTFITLATIGFGDFVALQGGQALEFNPGYVACSFIFLLVGLAALSSSINLLVLRFMILSMEEEELQEQELQDAAQNVVTLDSEVLAELNVNGGPSPSPGHHQVRTRESTSAAEAQSVCSCTCYGGGHGHRRTSADETERLRRQPARRLFYWLGKKLGCSDDTATDDDNFYDEETQSISNHARYTIKRASF